jgi:hypothetical protein
MNKTVRNHFMHLIIPWLMCLFAALYCIMQKEKILGRDPLPARMESFNNSCSIIWILFTTAGALINYHFQQWRKLPTRKNSKMQK